MKKNRLLNSAFLIIAALMLFKCGNNPTEPDVSPPPKVSGFAVGAPTGDLLITLAWQKSVATDLDYYILYRKKDLTPYVIVDSLTQTTYTDTVDSYVDEYSYKIVAVDKSGNVSEANEDVYNVQSGNNTPPLTPDSLLVFGTNRLGIKRMNVSWISKSIDVKKFLLLKSYTDSMRLVVDTINVDGSLRTYTDTVGMLNTYYKYTILSEDLGGKKSKESNSDLDIVLSKPELTFPIDNQIVKTSKVQFLFSSVKNSLKYELIISQTKDAVDTVFVSSNNGSSETIDIDLSKYSSIEKGMSVTWKILAYSKSMNVINSISYNGTFVYNP